MPGTKMFRAWPSTTACAEIPRAKSKKIMGPAGLADGAPVRSMTGVASVKNLFPSALGCCGGAAGTEAPDDGGCGEGHTDDGDSEHACQDIAGQGQEDSDVGQGGHTSGC